MDINECHVNADPSFTTNKKRTRSRSICVNGSCRNSPGSFSCDCFAGYHGELCAADIDECVHPDICNFGNCTNTIGGFDCKCWEGFVGDYCDTEANDSEHFSKKKSISEQSQSDVTESASSNLLLPIVIGIAAAVIVLIVIAIVVLIIIKRKRFSRNNTSDSVKDDTGEKEYSQVPQRDPSQS